MIANYRRYVLSVATAFVLTLGGMGTQFALAQDDSNPDETQQEQQPPQQEQQPAQQEQPPAPGEEPATQSQETPDSEDQAADKNAVKPEEEKVEPFTVKVANDTLEFSVSGTWKQVPPRSGMIEAEIKIPKLGDDKEDGRLTIMGAGGTIEANIERWQKQFALEDGELAEVKTEIKTIADQEVHLVDISGTYLDKPGGPFAGGATIERPGYRMLAAIIKTEKHGNYFLKLYGPKHTIKKNKKHFKAMVESLKVHAQDQKAKSAKSD